MTEEELRETMQDTEALLELAQSRIHAGDISRGLKLIRAARGKLNAELGEVGNHE